MVRTVKIRIEGSADDTDAPTADDLVDQLRDYLDIFRDVEGAVAVDGQSAIVWRVVGASKASPLEVEMQAFARHHGTSIDARASLVARQVSEGLRNLGQRPERPAFFNDDALKKTERIFKRVTNGLVRSEVEFGDDIETVVLTPFVARGAARNAGLVLKPIDKPYRELGTVEGRVQGVTVDGHRRRLLFLRHRLTGALVKCILTGRALEAMADYKVEDVFRGRRVTIQGTIHYSRPGQIFQVQGTDISFARSRSELPTVDDILDESFTGGMRTEQYLERMRDGQLAT